MPPIGDAVQERPTLEQEMAAFKGFSTTDGEVSDGSQTPEEAAVLAANEAAEAPAAAEKAAKPERKSPLSALLDPDGVDEEEDEADDPPAGEDGQAGAGEPDAVAEGDKKDAVADPTPPKKSKQTLQERVDEVTKHRREAERRATEAERRAADAEQRLNAALRGEKSALTPATAAATSESTEAAPDPSAFEYGELDPKYISALARHEAKQQLQIERSVDDKRRQDEAAEHSAREHVQKVATFAESGAVKYADFDDVVIVSAKAGEWPLTDTIGELMLGSEHGHDIAYHLATHPKEAQALAAKTPAAQAAMFGRMEAKLEAAAASQAATPPVKPSKAPPPVQKPRGPSGKYTPSASTNDFASFEKLAMGR